MIAAETKMVATRGFATHGPEAKFEPFEFTRREVGPNDILIDITLLRHLPLGHSSGKGEWEPMIPSIYPMVPGHEIVGRVAQVGTEVTKFSVGDIAGIGCFVDSCRECARCTGGSNSTASRCTRNDLQRHRNGPDHADVRRIFERSMSSTRTTR